MIPATESHRTRLTVQRETVARRLGWRPQSEITWREFLEQYPYAADAIRGEAPRDLPSVA